MAGLLVSVRDAIEARAAIEGGAAIVDVKEPLRGPLGVADASVWRAVVDIVGGRVPVSVALGEIPEREADGCLADCPGVRWRKLGLAGIGGDRQWRERWAAMRRSSPGPGWIAVAYLDAEVADAPSPRDVVDEAIACGCAGVLFDTWDKTRRVADDGWVELVEAVKDARRLVAVAGRLDVAAIERLQGLRPDYYAVRGAACRGADRLAAIEVDRVRRLVEAARG